MHATAPDHRLRLARPVTAFAAGSVLGLLLIAGCGGGGGDDDAATPDGPAPAASPGGTTGGPGDPGAAPATETLGPAPRPAEGVEMDARAGAAAIRYADAVDTAPEDPTARRELAFVLHANGVEDAAVEAWGHVLALTPDDPAAWYHRARLRKLQGDLDAAMTDIDRAVALAPDDAAIVARRGLWHLEAGRLEAAEADLRRAGEIDPRHRPAAEGMARLWIDTDRHALALRDILVPLRNRGEATPHTRFLVGQALRRMDRLEEAEIELEAGAGSSIDWVGADPWVAELQRYWVGERADLTRAQAMIDAGRESEAISLLEPLVVDAGIDAAPRVLLAQALRRTGEMARATELLSDGVAAQPQETTLIIGLAETRLADGDPAAAARLAQRAIDLNPRLPRAHEILARAAFDEGRWEAAEAAARAAVELDPTRRIANLFLGLAIDRQPQRRAEAFAQLQLTRRRHPDWWEPYYYLGAILGSARQFEDAVRFAVRAGELSPGNPRVAELLRVIGEQQQAAQGAPAP